MTHLGQSETSKIRHIAQPYCGGVGIDIGSGGDPVVPWAIQIDPMSSEYGTPVGMSTVQIVEDGLGLKWFADGTLNFVFSSHLIEDYHPPEWAVMFQDWIRVLAPGGHLIIAAPESSRWQAALAAGQPPNHHHKHEPELGELTAFFEERWPLAMTVIYESCPLDDDYNLVFVAERTTF